MNKKKIILISLAIVLVLIFMLRPKKTPAIKVCIHNRCFLAEVADTPEKRKKGLMFRQELGEDQGMLFVFKEEGIYSFWMKNMRFPLDIIWLDKNKKVVEIYSPALPCRDVCKDITPSHPARFVLELKAGSVLRHNIREGEYFQFKNF